MPCNASRTRSSCAPLRVDPQTRQPWNDRHPRHGHPERPLVAVELPGLEGHALRLRSHRGLREEVRGGTAVLTATVGPDAAADTLVLDTRDLVIESCSVDGVEAAFELQSDPHPVMAPR